MKHILAILLILALGACTSEPAPSEEIPLAEEKADTTVYELAEMLDGWGLAFMQKVDSSYQAIINFKLSDGAERYHLSIQNRRFVRIEGSNEDANFSFESTLAHFNQVYKGNMTALTSMGQASPDDPIPLKPDVHKAVTDNVLNDFLFFSQRFFNSYPYDLVKLGLEHSRVVHGGHAIPIFYQKTEDIGVRSAWYQINQGEQVNEPGDTNPFPQYFIVTEGVGRARIGSDTIRVNANEAYFIPPGSDHVFWNEAEEPLVLIFLAWGKGA